ncbi:type VII secretion-associated serine protease mycosin [Streptomyces sp. NPDC003703]|uniref:type VII secretion-associated serine protease mycosin n=1 Tax=Streptomyces sp. NPDC003283 TaxID=3364681 RepID=UPI0036CEF654
MRTREKRALRFLPATSALLSLLLVSLAAAPACADSIRARQWHLDAMHADEMWRTSTGRGITVAVVDSGVDDSVADLRGQVLDGKDYSTQQGDEHTDLANHGTGVASLIAATGGRGPLNGSYGLAPGVKILPVRMRYATEQFGQVDAGAEYARTMSEAIHYVADSKAQIINISMAASNTSGRKNVSTPELAAAVRYAISKGKLIFAGVGNSGDTSNLPAYPASTPGVVGVGAITQKIKRAPFSQHGAEVDVTAPGANMLHACVGKTKICESDGTSDATAIASASAALIWAKHPDWTNNQVLRVLINTMKGNEKSWTRNDDFGYGIVRPRAALQNPGDPGPPDEYPLPDLAAAASHSPSPKPAESRNASGTGQAHVSPPAAPAEPEESGSTPVRIGVGIAVVVLLGGVATVAVLRSRRRRRTPVPPPAPPTYHQPYAQPRQYPPHGPPPGHAAPMPPDGAPRPGHHP